MRILALTYVLDTLSRFCSVGSPEIFRNGGIEDWPENEQSREICWADSDGSQGQEESVQPIHVVDSSSLQTWTNFQPPSTEIWALGPFWLKSALDHIDQSERHVLVLVPVLVNAS